MATRTGTMGKVPRPGKRDILIPAPPPSGQAALDAVRANFSDLMREHGKSWIPNPGPQEQAFNSNAHLILFGGRAAGGKALALTTPLRTARGWTTMAEVKVGDVLFDENGLPCNVLAVTPPMYGRECFDVVFDDGAIIRADGEHQWRTLTARITTRRKSLWTTNEIGASLLYHGRQNHAVRVRSKRYCYITAVVPVQSEPVRCLQVDSPSGLFLAGRELIPTHNSSLLLGLARLRHQQSLLLRRTFTELERNLIKSAIVGFGRQYYNAGLHRFSFPDGRTIQFGHAEREQDVENYKSDEYDFVGIDEASDFTPFQLRFLFSRARAAPGTRAQVVFATNPGGPSGAFIRQGFAPWIDLGVAPGTILWRRLEDRRGAPEWIESDEHDDLAHSATFFPASVYDTPQVDQQEYQRMLALVPEPRQSQLARGDWTAGEDDEEYQVIPGADVRRAFANWKRWKAAGGPIPPVMDCCGCDIGSLQDQSVIAPRFGNLVPFLQKHRIKDTMEVAGHIILVMRQMRGGALIDVDGIGNGVFFRLREQGYPVLGFHGGLGGEFYDESGTMRFANLRAAAYFRMKWLLDPANGHVIALPPDERLYAGLTAVRWRVGSSGRIGITPKSKVEAGGRSVRSILGYSPDEADAVAMAFWTDVEGQEELEEVSRTNSLLYANDRPVRQLMGLMR